MVANQRPSGINIFALEGDWDRDLRVRDSVVPILELLDRLKISRYIHRDAATREELFYYLDEWTKRRYDSYGLLYLAFHGDSGGISLGRDVVTLDELRDGLGPGRLSRKSTQGDSTARRPPRTIHFASCLSLAAADDEMKRFVRDTGAVAITGYETEVDWIDSAAFEVLLLDRLARGGRTDAVYRDLHRSHGEFATRLGLVAATASRVYRGSRSAS